MWARALFAVIGLSMSGCMTVYSVPPQAAQATITLVADEVDSGLGGMIYVYNPETDSLAQLGGDVFVAYGSANKIEAGRRMLLRVSSNLGETNAVYLCSNAFSFTPEAGHSYHVVQPIDSSRGCTVRLSDASDGVTPSSFRREDLNRMLFDHERP